MPANNAMYIGTRGYQITLIDPKADSEYFDKLAEMPLTTYDRSYTSDDLNHHVFTTYF